MILTVVNPHALKINYQHKAAPQNKGNERRAVIWLRSSHKTIICKIIVKQSIYTFELANKK